ncbi:hypothetical protein KJ781_01860 [Patescibacteria group bacterium]|nr:hypothetical protein [Patescibacteria group bacterium]MBU1448338.1 hypothetical protein [Patescibacteria group bacterium]MBU2613130.1 hypothetical protein [Patescibacteria group bacterium]
MPRTVIASASRRREDPPEEMCLVQASAEFVSVAGALLLVLCTFCTAAFVSTVLAERGTEIQRFIAAVLSVAAWMYFLNAVTERLSLCGSTLTLSSVLGRRHDFQLDDLDAMSLTHEGLNIDRGFETIRFRMHGGRGEKVTLGPCWNRETLDAFVRSVDRALASRPASDARR